MGERRRRVITVELKKGVMIVVTLAAEVLVKKSRSILKVPTEVSWVLMKKKVRRL